MKKAGLLIVIIMLIAGVAGGLYLYKQPSPEVARRDRATSSSQRQPLPNDSAARPADKAEPVARTLSVTLYETSSEPVNVVQTTVTYPANRLKLTSIKNAANFTVEAQTERNDGRLRLVRATFRKDLTGRQAVATLNFSVSGPATAADIRLDTSQAAIVSTTTNTNILPSGGRLELAAN